MIPSQSPQSLVIATTTHINKTLDEECGKTKYPEKPTCT